MIFCAWVSEREPPNTVKSLKKQIDRAAVDGAPAGDDAVAGDLLLLHAELVRAVLDEHVELLERAFVEQELDALAGGELAALVLRLDALVAAAGPRLFAALFEFVEDVFHALVYTVFCFEAAALLKRHSASAMPKVMRPASSTETGVAPIRSNHCV
jgi:hypothetical protein